MILGKNLSRLIFGADSESTKTASSQGVDHDEVIKVAKGLEKVASYPLNPSTYPALVGMIKIASQVISSLDSEVSRLKGSVNDLEKRAEVRILVDDLIENGLTNEFDAEEKVASLLEKDKKELEMVKEAMQLAVRMSSGDLFEEMDKTASTSRKKEMFEGIL